MNTTSMKDSELLGWVKKGISHEARLCLTELLTRDKDNLLKELSLETDMVVVYRIQGGLKRIESMLKMISIHV